MAGKSSVSKDPNAHDPNDSPGVAAKKARLRHAQKSFSKKPTPSLERDLPAAAAPNPPVGSMAPVDTSGGMGDFSALLSKLKGARKLPL